jgi:hypothetical protein
LEFVKEFEMVKLIVDFLVNGSEHREINEYSSIEGAPNKKEYLEDLKNYWDTNNVIIKGFYFEEI